MLHSTRLCLTHAHALRPSPIDAGARPVAFGFRSGMWTTADSAPGPVTACLWGSAPSARHWACPMAVGAEWGGRGPQHMDRRHMALPQGTRHMSLCIRI